MFLVNLVPRSDQPNMLGSFASWNTLSMILGVPPEILTYVLLNRNLMQTKLVLNDRIVYRSDAQLKQIQTLIMGLLNPIVDKLPDQNVILSYRNCSYVRSLHKKCGAWRLISWDVTKFFDHVTLSHIQSTLMTHGFSRLGANLISRYCVVRNTRGTETLQQGSPASPVLSNLVGYEYIDKPLLKWLEENCTVPYQYVRYCDNVELFLKTETPPGFYSEYKQFVNKTMSKAGFKTHDWSNVSQNNPVRNQKFLGTVMNHALRLDKAKQDRLRAMLFNMSIKNLREQLDRMGTSLVGNAEASPRPLKAMSVLKGYLSYLKPINPVLHRQLNKLYSIVAYRYKRSDDGIRQESDDTREYMQSEEWINLVKSYKNTKETVKDFTSRVVSKNLKPNYKLA